MKKTKFIAGIAALSIMMTGAGYAMWNQNFAATNDVTVGEFKVTTTAGTITDNPYVTEHIDKATTGDTNNIVVTIDKAYPGAIFDYDFTVKNEGTMGIKLENSADPQIIVTDETGKEVSLTADEIKAFMTVEQVSTDNKGIIFPDQGSNTNIFRYRVTFNSTITDQKYENLKFKIVTNPNYVQFNQ